MLPKTEPKENAVKSGMTDLALLKSGLIPFLTNASFTTVYEGLLFF